MPGICHPDIVQHARYIYLYTPRMMPLNHDDKHTPIPNFNQNFKTGEKKGEPTPPQTEQHKTAYARIKHTHTHRMAAAGADEGASRTAAISAGFKL